MSVPVRSPPSETASNPRRGGRSMARGEIAVGISSTYRKYHPGRRRLAPITLLPKRDTTAYICDEYKVPLASSKDGKVHIEYLIGWTDLRAGMISIDAEHVRDYVSAQEYEEWNIKKAAERDEELRKEEEAENVKLVKDMEKAQREAKKKESGIVLRNGTLRIPGQSTTREQTSAHAPSRGRKKRSKHVHQRIPSLSNPQPLMTLPHAEFYDTETDGQDSNGNEEASIRRQLEGEHTTGESSSMAGSSRAVSTLSQRREGSSGSHEPPQKKRRTVSPFPLPLTEPSRELDAARAGGSPARWRPDHVQSLELPASQTSPGSPARAPTPGSTSKPLFAPAKQISAEHPTAVGGQAGVPIRSLPVTSPGAMRPVLAATHPLTTNIQSSTPRTGFTPLGGQRSSPWASFSSTRKVAARVPSVEPPSPKKSTPKKLSTSIGEPSLSASKMTTQKPRSPSTDDENQTEEVYEVKRLEGTKIYDTEAGPQRYFLVRWKGSWPKGQNPTWEPESYIPKDMARRFLMKQGAALGMDGVTNSPDDPAHSPWEKSKKWSSVSEAFAGENDGPELEGGDSGNSAHNNQPSSGRSYDADELLLVTDEFSPAKKPALSWDMLMGRKFGEST